MGIQRSIRYTTLPAPEWPAIAGKLTEIGEATTVRMIDGMPAFPDEIPEPGWQELRLGLTGGMVTLRRIPDGYACITWGTADPALTRSWNHLCWAAAAAGGGTVSDQHGNHTPEQFRATLG